MIDGSTPPSAPATHVAIGVIPSSFAFSSLITTTAAAPSLIEEALPAVTRPPSGLNAGRSFASDSFVVPARGPSSVSTMIVSFFFLTSIGTISSLNLPASRAAQAFCWLLAANSSSSSLVMPHLVADVLCGDSHVIAVESIPQGVIYHGVDHRSVVHTVAVTCVH